MKRGLTSFKDILDCPYRAVYGTLMMGHGNYEYYMGGITPFAIDTVTGYILRDNGGYPAAFEAGEDDAIYVELFDMGQVPGDWESNLDSMDRMEKGAGYTKRLVTTSRGYKVWMYVMPDEAAHYFPNEVPTGNWNHLSLHNY